MKQNSFALFLLFIILCISCQSPQVEKKSSEQIVKNYFDQLNAADFKTIETSFADNVQWTEMDKTVANSKGGMYNLFQFDSVLNAHYEVLNMKKVNESVEVTVSKTCDRIDFLQDSIIVFKSVFDINDQLITKIHTKEYVLLDTDKWAVRLDTLNTWIDALHPELSGFVYSQTKTSAEKYLKAMNLFNSQAEVQ